jgi:hypothetical protein
MMYLSAALAFVLVAAANPSRPCTPAKASERVRVSFLADSDLGVLTKWAKEVTCTDYGFESALASRRLAQGVILTVKGSDVSQTVEILLHTMNLRSYARGSQRWIVPAGPETTESRETNQRARADGERERTLANLDAELKRTDDTHYTLTRKGADAVLTSLPSLARSLRVAPQSQDGKIIGFRLVSLRPGALWARVGLQRGDVVTALNGSELTTPERALEAYARFRSTGVMRADFLRAGQPHSIEITVE